MRDYGTGQWTGGDEACDHSSAAPSRDSDEEVQRRKAKYEAEGRSTGQHGGWESRATRADGSAVCRCGAQRVDSQLGLEPTPTEYVENMVALFREVRRVLRDDGTLWLNLGDSFHSGTQFNPSAKTVYDEGSLNGHRPRVPGLKPKDLVGIPWRVAFALQADGWYLRSDIIWSKPNPMPESVTDRPTKAHEYLFLFSKQPRYFYDADAIREPHQDAQGHWTRSINGPMSTGDSPEHHRGDAKTLAMPTREYNSAGRNRRSVWTIAQETGDAESLARAFHSEYERLAPQFHYRTRPDSAVPWEDVPEDNRRLMVATAAALLRGAKRDIWQIPTEPFPEAHFATYPQELVRPCILAGTSERGECVECGAPWTRQTETTLHPVQKTFESRAPDDGYVKKPAGHIPATSSTETTGWAPSCSCVGISHAGLLPSGKSISASEPPATRPQLVLDPFIGSGTTALVARKHGRRSLGIDLSESYLAIAAKRTQQLSLLGGVA